MGLCSLLPSVKRLNGNKEIFPRKIRIFQALLPSVKRLNGNKIPNTDAKPVSSFASICEASEWKHARTTTVGGNIESSFASICEASEWKR